MSNLNSNVILNSNLTAGDLLLNINSYNFKMIKYIIILHDVNFNSSKKFYTKIWFINDSGGLDSGIFTVRREQSTAKLIVIIDVLTGNLYSIEKIYS